jgi:hypothetical protein
MNKEVHYMDNGILKKRLNTFKSSKGVITAVADDVVVDLLRAWEAWPGTSKKFYQDLRLSKQQLAVLIRKGKKLVRNGVEGEFKEIKLQPMKLGPSCQDPIVLNWDHGKVIQFSRVEQLVDFLKKVA